MTTVAGHVSVARFVGVTPGYCVLMSDSAPLMRDAILSAEVVGVDDEVVDAAPSCASTRLSAIAVAIDM